MKWVAAAILAGAGIWGGVTWAIILSGTKWRWIPVAIAVEAVIVAGAIVIPKLRPKLLLGAGVAAFMTAIAVAYLLHAGGASAITGAAGLLTIATPSRCGAASSWRVLDSSSGSCWCPSPGRSLTEDVGPTGSPKALRARETSTPAGSPEREGALATEDASAPFASHRRFSSSRSIPTSTALRVRSSSQSIRSSAKVDLLRPRRERDTRTEPLQTPRSTRANRAPWEYRRRVDPKRISLPVVGFVLSCIATAMTSGIRLAHRWGTGTPDSGTVRKQPSGQGMCVACGPTVVTSGGWTGLALCPARVGGARDPHWAATRRSGGGKESTLVLFGIIVAIVGTLIVAYMALNFVDRVAGEFG